MKLITPDQLPPADSVIQYQDGSIGPLMFHYAVEGCDCDAIAQENGFEIGSRLLENDADGVDAFELYQDMAFNGHSKVTLAQIMEAWQPKVPDGWKLVGKHDTEDGPIAVFLRHTSASEGMKE